MDKKTLYTIGMAIALCVLVFAVFSYINVSFRETGENAKAAGLGEQANRQVPSTQQQQASQNTAANARQQQANQTQQANATAQEKNDSGATAVAKKEVVVDFLYADWCPHCQRMKPVVDEVAAVFPSDRFEMRKWNEKDRGSDSETSSIYSLYSGRGYFLGFPTFVANGNSPQVGEMSKEDMIGWLCTLFSPPKPDVC